MSENEIELEFKATIEDGWYLYSQYLPVDADAFPTKITFLASQDYELVGETIEPEPIKAFDPNYDMELSYFKEEVIFKQRIKIKTANSFLVNGEISFMSCDDSQCVFPPIEEFQYTIGPTPSFLKAEDPIVEAEDKTDKIDGDQKTNKISR